MKLLKSALFGMAATTASIFSTVVHGTWNQLGLLALSLLLWVGFIAAIVRALKPE